MVIPNHSRIDELQEALASVAEQCYPGEIHTYLVYRPRPEIAPLIEEFGPHLTAIPYTDQVDNNPISAKRNQGIAATDQDLVAFLDDDDVWHPHKLRIQVEALLSKPTAVAVGSQHLLFRDEPPWKLGSLEPRVRQLSNLSQLRGNALATSSLLANGPIVRELLFDERAEWLAVEDYDLKIRLGERGIMRRVEGEYTAIRVGLASESQQDRRLQYVRSLSVLAESAKGGTQMAARRLIALETMVMAAFAGGHDVSDMADSQLEEALDGRLFGRSDQAFAGLIRRAWRAGHLREATQAVHSRAKAIRRE